MEEFDKVDPSYLKGFNEGYTMAQHVPELAEQLSHVKNDSERGKGFRDGRNQFTNEKLKEMRPSWLKGERKSTEPSKSNKAPMRGIDPDK